MSIKTLLLVAVILLLETVTASFASYCLKRSSSSEPAKNAGGPAGASSSKGLGKLSILISPFFYFGGFLYVFSACMSILLLQFLPYAIVLPIGSLTYVWTLLLSRKLLGEEITRRKLLGVTVIICGVILLAVGQV